MAPTTTEHADQVLGPSLKAFRRLGQFPYPVCLFFFTMRDDRAYYTWLLEPVVTPRGKPKLARRAEAACEPLDNGGLDQLVSRVHAWYDALYADLSASP